MTKLAPLLALPGVCKVDSAYLNSVKQAYFETKQNVGRYTDMDKCRFVQGQPEKLAGWEKFTATQLTGVPRGMRSWRDFSQIVYLAIGTNKKLYAYSQNTVTDITPRRGIETGTLSNKLNTINASSAVTVNDVAHGLTAGDYTYLTASATVGGLTIAGVYPVTSVTDVDNYVITASSDASSTVSNGGGTLTYTYYRKTLTNPFSTTSGSTTVTVVHASHGALNGDYVTISNSSAVGGVTPSGEYVLTYVDANTYTITVSSPASGTVSGGGGSPQVQYDINTGFADTVIGYGYGTGGYGSGGYGAASSTGVTNTARTWSLARYGQLLLANPNGGGIYVWDPSVGGRAYPLYGAPTTVSAMFVTPERFVMALGDTSSNFMKVSWPDQNDFTNWVSTATNTANEGRTLQEGSYLVSGVGVRDFVSLVWSNTAVYAFSYRGDNNVYSSTPVGVNAGLVGPLAWGVMGGAAYWFGFSNLWTWDGTARPIISGDIRDYIYDDINIAQSYKFVVGTNIARKEIWYFWCSSAATEIDRYAIYHTDQGCFSTGSMVRTSWIDRDLFDLPLATDADGYIYSHETGTDADGSAMNAYVTLGPMDVASGSQLVDIMGMYPDFKSQAGAVEISVTTQNYPQSAVVTYGPYTAAADGSNAKIDLRIGTRMFGFTLTSNTVGGDFRVGMPKVELQAAGVRR